MEYVLLVGDAVVQLDECSPKRSSLVALRANESQLQAARLVFTHSNSGEAFLLKEEIGVAARQTTTKKAMLSDKRPVIVSIWRHPTFASFVAIPSLDEEEDDDDMDDRTALDHVSTMKAVVKLREGLLLMLKIVLSDESFPSVLGACVLLDIDKHRKVLGEQEYAEHRDSIKAREISEDVASLLYQHEPISASLSRRIRRVRKKVGKRVKKAGFKKLGKKIKGKSKKKRKSQKEKKKAKKQKEKKRKKKGKRTISSMTKSSTSPILTLA